MASVFVDTNVLLYARDPTDPTKSSMARRWLETLGAREAAVISPQVVNEFVAASLRRFRGTSQEEIHRRAMALLAWCRVPLEAQTSALAMTVQSRYGTSWWDGLIVASALQAECRYLLSEDMQPGMTFGQLTVINPFETTPQALLDPS
jgi:predicted nucleic acid-binding protein